MVEPKNGRTIFFPQKLVLLGNLALFAWIVLDAIAFLMFDLTIGIVFLVATLILIYGLSCSNQVSSIETFPVDKLNKF